MSPDGQLRGVPHAADDSLRVYSTHGTACAQHGDAPPRPAVVSTSRSGRRTAASWWRRWPGAATCHGRSSAQATVEVVILPFANGRVGASEGRCLRKRIRCTRIPSWSPDGQWIVFASRSRRAGDLAQPHDPPAAGPPDRRHDSHARPGHPDDGRTARPPIRSSRPRGSKIAACCSSPSTRALTTACSGGTTIVANRSRQLWMAAIDLTKLPASPRPGGRSFQRAGLAARAGRAAIRTSLPAWSDAAFPAAAGCGPGARGPLRPGRCVAISP